MKANVTAIGLLALGVLRRRLVVVTVIGLSMAPTYSPGERVLVRRVPAHALRRGQVVVFREPDPAGGWARPSAGPDVAEDRSAAPMDGQAAGPTGWMIKRVAAAPGDPVPRDVADVLGEASGAAVPPNRFVVVGDNPNGSFDSRKFGYLPGDQVLGVVVRRLGGRRPVAGDTVDVEPDTPEMSLDPVELGSQAQPGSTVPDPAVEPGPVQPSRAAAGSGPVPVGRRPDPQGSASPVRTGRAASARPATASMRRRPTPSRSGRSCGPEGDD